MINMVKAKKKLNVNTKLNVSTIMSILFGCTLGTMPAVYNHAEGEETKETYKTLSHYVSKPTLCREADMAKEIMEVEYNPVTRYLFHNKKYKVLSEILDECKTGR
ncbi:MAG: hypothetical protein ABIB71_02040 [Candidatus Woesearchaeota archaeon]